MTHNSEFPYIPGHLKQVLIPNQLFRYFLNALVDISDYYISRKRPGLPLSTDHLEHHRAILDALKKKNIAETKRALIRHLKSVKRHYDLRSRSREGNMAVKV